MNYVIDTHALIWYFTGDSRLGSSALNAIENTVFDGLIIVPTIVLAEILYLGKRKKIPVSFKETIKQMENLENFNITGLELDILKTADNIDNELEMHDKLIVATALYFEADALITKDEKITISKLVPIIW